MRRGIAGLLAGTLVALALAALAPDAPAQQPVPRAMGVDTANQCLACHAAQREAATVGVHSQQGVRCVDCHGGNPDVAALPAAHQGGFVGRLNKVQTAELCGSCHSDPNKMRAYGLPTGQLAQFRTSKHGQLLFGSGNTDAPTCAPTCISCHGAHSALPPTGGEIASVCGQCHQLVDQAFQQGPHGLASKAGSLHGCLACHSNHGTERVAAGNIAATCDKCHASNTKLHQMGIDLQRRVVQAQQDMASAARAIDLLSAAGAQVGYYKFRYQSALTYYGQIAQAQHSLDLEKVDGLARRVRSVSVDLTTASDTKQENRWEHKLVLVPVW
ncbi:MAG: hypothetical protein B7Z72_15230, partial [Gemmatimonadetes bacterium 21-71-4]